MLQLDATLHFYTLQKESKMGESEQKPALRTSWFVPGSPIKGGARESLPLVLPL